MSPFDGPIDLPSGPVRVVVRGSGPPLLWCHGVFFPIDVDDASTLGHVLGSLDQFTVVRWDARGHGRTPEREDAAAHRWDRMAEDVVALADALGVDRFLSGGISMGAAVALHAALRTPSRVAAMLLLALPTAWETRPPERARYLELLTLGTSDALAIHVERDFDALFLGAPWPASLVAMVAELRRASWTALERVIAGAAESDMPDRGDLSRLEIPILLRPWPNDAGHPLSTAEALAGLLPKSDLALLEGFDDEPGMRAAFADLRGRCGALGAPR